MTLTKQQVNQLTCTASSLNIVSNGKTNKVVYKELTCSLQNKEVLKEIGGCANNAATLIRVGWKIDLPDLIPIYDVCFDKGNMRNYYSVSVIPGNSILAKSSGARSDDWTKNDYRTYFGNIDVDTQYKKAQQPATMLRILGNQATVDRYFNYVKSELFFSRGHLAANADFVDKASQDSTFNYINAAVNAKNHKL